MRTPLVSIIIPTYNRDYLIVETIDSVLKQTYNNWECIIVDDGSTDNTEQIIKSYCDNDSRIKFHKRPKDRPKGGNVCRNYGFELSKGEFINWLDSDDLFSSNKIQEQVNGIIESNADIATCSWGNFEENIGNLFLYKNQPFYSSFNRGIDLLNAFGKNGGFFPPHVYLVKRSLIENTGSWDEALYINQDAEYFSRILLNCKKVHFISTVTVYYRRKIGDNVSLTNSLEKMIQRIESWILIEKNIKKKNKYFSLRYVNKAKESLFLNLLKEYPILVTRYNKFFKRQILILKLNNIKKLIIKKLNGQSDKIDS